MTTERHRSDTTDFAAQTIAGHSFTRRAYAGGMLSLRIALGGGDLVALARGLAKLDGVRVTGGPGGDRERCFLVSCSGFKMVLSCPADEPADCAAALVSRMPAAALTVVSDLGNMLDRLMTEPTTTTTTPPPRVSTSSIRRSGLQQTKPLTRKTQLTRKTPLARSPFRKPWDKS